MTEPDNFAARYALYRDELAKTNAHNKAVLFDALAEAGITHICVEFDGESDSGQIDNIAAYKGDELAPLPDRKLPIRGIGFGGSEAATEDRAVADFVESLCYDFLEQEHGGWENNDGGFGSFFLEVGKREIRLTFNARFSDFTTFTQTF